MAQETEFERKVEDGVAMVSSIMGRAGLMHKGSKKYFKEFDKIQRATVAYFLAHPNDDVTIRGR